MSDRPRLGAWLDRDGATFRLRTTGHRACEVRLDGRTVAMHVEADGLFAAHVPGVAHGERYSFAGDGGAAIADPYARWLPDGIGGPAAVCRETYPWRHAAITRPLAEHVLYELHVGTFTETGTYEAAAERLPYLAGLGVTALELMPLGAFAGRRGWGYDGVAHFAPHPAYGTPEQLKAFIDAAHGHRLAVLLDVVYNHFGPEGAALPATCPGVLTRERTTGWGDALDFRVPAMRDYVLANVAMWLDEYRFDGLRLDAVHAIVEPGEPHIVAEIARIAGDRALAIAEDERNERDPIAIEQLGCDAVWADDFHHNVHVTLTGERDGYYAAYPGGAAGLARAIDRFADRLPASAFVYCLQNHDQVGNRAFGDRLTASVPIDAYCAVSMLMLFLPMTPLLFMGQEWAASSPFLYFTDHPPELGAKVADGRRAEFARFTAFSDPATRQAIPDPQADDTFERSQLRWAERDRPAHARVLALYRDLLRLRATDTVLSTAGRDRLRAAVHGPVLSVLRWTDSAARALHVNLSAEPATAVDGDLAASHVIAATAPANLFPFPRLAPWSAVIVDGAMPT